MLFSECFGIDLDGNEPWFDPLLTLDTKLYIDPFLIFQDEFGPFVGSHQELMAFYDVAFQLVAESGRTKSGFHWDKAISILGTPEVEELCLGVTASGTRGAGAGKGKARLIAEALHTAIKFGLANPRHFETIQLFQKDIAEDTISDAVGNILRHRFSAYTKLVCDEYGIPTEKRPHLRGRFNFEACRWESVYIDAPINPCSGKQILLVPKRYLRPMPTLNPGAYWGFCYGQAPNELRMNLGEEISRNVNKDVILEKALKDYSSVNEFINLIEEIGGDPYDFDGDPKGLVKWYRESRDFVRKHPVELSFSGAKDFPEFLDKLLDTFRNYVENQGGWELIYNDDGTPKSESACQRLFLGVVRHYCKANNIDVSPEVNIGRGPVDFKMSRGASMAALIEMKLAKNTKFWNGLEKQLPKYLEAEDIDLGHFLVIVFSRADCDKLRDIHERVVKVNSKTSYKITYSVVDAQFRPLSASKL